MTGTRYDLSGLWKNPYHVDLAQSGLIAFLHIKNRGVRNRCCCKMHYLDLGLARAASEGAIADLHVAG